MHSKYKEKSNKRQKPKKDFTTLNRAPGLYYKWHKAERIPAWLCEMRPVAGAAETGEAAAAKRRH